MDRKNNMQFHQIWKQLVLLIWVWWWLSFLLFRRHPPRRRTTYAQHHLQRSKSVTKALIAGVQDSKGEMSFTHREEHEPMQETDKDQC